VSEGPRRGVGVGVGEYPGAQAITGDRFVAVQGEVGDHFNAAATQRRGEGFDQAHDARFAAQQFGAKCEASSGGRGRWWRATQRRAVARVRYSRIGQTNRNGEGTQFAVEIVWLAYVHHERRTQAPRREGPQQFRFTGGERDPSTFVQRDDGVDYVVVIPILSHLELATFAGKGDQHAFVTAAQRADHHRFDILRQSTRGVLRRDAHHALERITNREAQLSDQLWVVGAQQGNGFVNLNLARRELVLAHRVLAPFSNEGQRQRARGQQVGQGGVFERRRCAIRRRFEIG